MHKASGKVLRLTWIKRRARRLQRFFRTDRATAVDQATVDWYRFNGQPLPQKSSEVAA